MKWITFNIKLVNLSTIKANTITKSGGYKEKFLDQFMVNLCMNTDMILWIWIYKYGIDERFDRSAFINLQISFLSSLLAKITRIRNNKTYLYDGM